MRQLLCLAISLTITGTACIMKEKPSETIPGLLITYSGFASAHVDPHTVRAWLPPGYDQALRYPVLYMHDGQMLFDSLQSWNGQSWGVDATMDRLIRTGSIRPAIVVAIDNAGAYRAAEYFPEAILDSFPPDKLKSLLNRWLADSPRADAYLRFLTGELKPFIDSAYSTLPDRPNTFIMGSSMGGLISLYALCEYPDIFGGAGCLSTHWPMYVPFETPPEGADFPAAFRGYLQQKLPPPGHHRIYFDHGTATLDAWYPALQEQVDNLLRKQGYTERDWITRSFPGTPHTEQAWGERLHIALEFLLPASR